VSAQAPYGRLPQSLWTDPSFRSLTPDEQRLFLYLLTGPHAHMCGISQVAIATMADDLRLGDDAIRAAIAGPLEDRVAYDHETREVFVRDAGRTQVGPELKSGDNRRVAILRHLEGIHSPKLKAEFFAIYGSPWNLSREAPPEAPPEDYSKPASTATTASTPTTAPAARPSRGAVGRQAGLSTGERQRRADPDEARQAAKAIAKPGAVDRWVTWIDEQGEAGLALAIGLRHAVDRDLTSWPRGELFATPDVFGKCTGLAAQAQSAYWAIVNGSGVDRNASELERIPSEPDLRTADTNGSPSVRPSTKEN